MGESTFILMVTQNYKCFAASKLAKEATCLKLLIDMRTGINQVGEKT